MEDEEFPKERTWDLREMEWKDRTNQHSSPPTDQHVDSNSPIRRPREVTQRVKQDACSRFYRVVLHDLKKDAVELGKTRVFYRMFTSSSSEF
jgi:hypothetical protein